MTTPETEPTCPLCGYSLTAGCCSSCGGHAYAWPGGPAIRPGRGFFLFDLLHGFSAFFRAGFQLLTVEELRSKLGLPLLANLIAVIALAAAAWFGFSELSLWLAGEDWGWLEFLRGWGTSLLALTLSIITLALFGPVIIEVVASPFLEPLADRTEKLLGGSGMQPVRISTWASASACIQAIALQSVALLSCLLLTFCGVGLIISFGLGAFVNALVWFEIPFARRKASSRTRLAVLRHNWARAIGFGLALQLGLFIPVFNLFFLAPAAVVAASTLYLHLEKELG